MVRNRCKRRLREVVRKYQPGAFFPSGFDLVLNVKTGLTEADFRQIQESFSHVMNRYCDLVRKQNS